MAVFLRSGTLFNRHKIDAAPAHAAVASASLLDQSAKPDL